MRWKGLLALAAICALIAGCGGDDESDSGDSGPPSTEEARQTVIDMIAAYGDGPDWTAVCDLSDQRAIDSITETTDKDDCAEAYQFIEDNQGDLVEGDKTPIDDFADLLATYEVGDAKITDEGATVKLEGDSPATSRLVDEDGEWKVQELFVTPDAAEPGSFDLPSESGQQ